MVRLSLKRLEFLTEWSAARAASLVEDAVRVARSDLRTPASATPGRLHMKCLDSPPPFHSLPVSFLLLLHPVISISVKLWRETLTTFKLGCNTFGFVRKKRNIFRQKMETFLNQVLSIPGNSEHLKKKDFYKGSLEIETFTSRTLKKWSVTIDSTSEALQIDSTNEALQTRENKVWRACHCSTK